MNSDRKRVCLITGASGRLGSMFCRLYGHRYHIAAVSHTAPVNPPPEMTWTIDPFESLARKPARSTRFLAIQADLAEQDSIARIVDLALGEFGGVDLLVNAAAAVHLAPLLSDQFSTSQLMRMFEVNTSAPLRLAIELANRFWRSRVDENTALNRGIVNVSSTSGAYVFPDIGQAGYSASKSALNMLTSHMAEEFSALGIRVNCVAPDSFPARITTESVCDVIARVDRDAVTGQMLMLEPEGETVV